MVSSRWCTQRGDLLTGSERQGDTCAGCRIDVGDQAGAYVIRADVEPGGITQVRPLAGDLTADAAAGELALFDLDRPGFAAGVFIGLPIERG